MSGLYGGDFPPYQTICGKVGSCGQGKLFRHGRAADKKIAVFKYNTTVPNPLGGPDIPPDERFQCNPDGCDASNCHDGCLGETGGPPCQPFGRPYAATVWLPDPSTVDYSVCHKIGWKAVQAMRYWNGRGSYYSSGSDNLLGCEPGPPNIVQWLSYQALPDRTKYRTITVTSAWSGPQFDFTGSPPYYTTVNATCDYTQTLGPHSGLFTISGWDFSPNAYDNAATEQPGNSNQAIYQTSFAYWYLSDAISRFTTLLGATTGGTITYGSGGITVTFDNGLGTQVNEEVITWSIDVNGTSSFDRLLYDFAVNTDTGEQDPVLVYHEHCDLTATTISYASETYTYGCFVEHPPGTPPSPQNETTIAVTGTLSDPVTDTDIYNDVNDNLLSTWPLNDDKLYPFRTDLVVGVAPLVTRDEIAFSDWPQPTSFVVKDFGAHVANGPNSFHGSTDVSGLDMPDPNWDGICGLVTPTDINSGVTAVALAMDGLGDFDGQTAGDPFGWADPGSVTYGTYRGILPVGVSFDAATGNFSGTGTVAGNYGVTVPVTGPPAATGNIIGAPLPAGYQNQWDWYFEDWRGCCCDDHPELCGDSTGWSWSRYGWGMNAQGFNNATGCQLPLNATHWTNWYEAMNKPVGAWLFFNDQTEYFGAGGCTGESAGTARNGNALWACKYAEIIDLWLSQDFSRPGGPDKFSYDEQNPVYCAANLSGAGAGSTWTITAYDGSTPASPDFSGVWGGASVGGFYAVAGYSAGTLTLGAKAWNVPSDWASANGDDTGSCFGKMRFPGAASILGRAGITPDMTGMSFTFADPQTTFGMVATGAVGTETVDLWDKEMTPVAAGVTATRSTDSVFTTTVAYPTAAYLTIHGAPDWYMHDNRPKGYYGYLTFMSDFRSQQEAGRLAAATDCSGSPVGGGPTTNNGGGPLDNLFAAFSQTNDCLPFKRCSPRVVCISPNGETFDNGVVYDFPDILDSGAAPSAHPQKFYFDQTYGIKWWGWVQATMTDLLWQPPHPPCGYEKTTDNGDDTTTTETLVWGMDDGSCTGPPPSGGGVECDPAATAAPDCDVTVIDESGNTTITHHKFYAHAPQVEPRFAVPCDYGVSQDECAPALPAGIQIGWSSPVTATTGDIAMPPKPPGITEEGTPGLANMAFWLHYNMCQTVGTGCRFNYPILGC